MLLVLAKGEVKVPSALGLLLELAGLPEVLVAGWKVGHVPLASRMLGPRSTSCMHAVLVGQNSAHVIQHDGACT